MLIGWQITVYDLPHCKGRVLGSFAGTALSNEASRWETREECWRIANGTNYGGKGGKSLFAGCWWEGVEASGGNSRS